MSARLLIALLLVALPAQALVLDTPLADPAQEAAAQRLFHDMKCVVCEGQSLAESDAEFAVQMRSTIRHQLREGSSAEQVRAYFVTRYGDRIMLTPPLNSHTYLLWAAPLLMVLGGGIFLWRHTRHHSGDRA